MCTCRSIRAEACLAAKSAGWTTITNACCSAIIATHSAHHRRSLLSEASTATPVGTTREALVARARVHWLEPCWLGCYRLARYHTYCLQPVLSRVPTGQWCVVASVCLFVCAPACLPACDGCTARSVLHCVLKSVRKIFCSGAHASAPEHCSRGMLPLLEGVRLAQPVQGSRRLQLGLEPSAACALAGFAALARS